MWYLYLSEPPRSHLLTALFVTPNASASCCCVISSALRRAATKAPIFSPSIPMPPSGARPGAFTMPGPAAWHVYFTTHPPGGATHGLWRPCLRSVERAVPRQGPPIPAKCRPGGAPVFTGQVHMALQTKGTISPIATQSPPWGLSMLFQPGAKPFAAAPGPQKFRRLFFVQPARLQSDDGSAFASRGQPGNLGQATA